MRIKTLLTITFLLNFIVSHGQDVTALLKDADSKMQKQDYFGAIYTFGKVLEKDPSNVDGYCGRAKARIETRDLENALKDANSAVDKNPQSPKAYTTLSEVYIAQREYGKALQAINESLQKKADNPYALNKKVFILMELGNEKDAESLLDDAIKSFPSYGPLYLTSGIFNNKKERYKKAVNDFDKAMETETKANAYDVYLNRGFAQIQLLDNEAALEDFSKAIDLQPNSGSAYQGRGRVYYAQGIYDQAVKDLETALQYNENNPILYYDLAMSYLRMDDLTNACVNFQKSCKLGNKNACKKILFECTERVENL